MHMYGTKQTGGWWARRGRWPAAVGAADPLGTQASVASGSPTGLFQMQFHGCNGVPPLVWRVSFHSTEEVGTHAPAGTVSVGAEPLWPRSRPGPRHWREGGHMEAGGQQWQGQPGHDALCQGPVTKSFPQITPGLHFQVRYRKPLVRGGGVFWVSARVFSWLTTRKLDLFSSTYSSAIQVVFKQVSISTCFFCPHHYFISCRWHFHKEKPSAELAVGDPAGVSIILHNDNTPIPAYFPKHCLALPCLAIQIKI